MHGHSQLVLRHLSGERRDHIGRRHRHGGDRAVTSSTLKRCLRPLQWTLVLLAVSGVAWASATRDRQPGDRVLAAQTTTGGTGSCDVDGVQLAYASQYAPATYHVKDVTVSGISPTCAGAELKIVLSDQSSAPLANGTEVVELPSTGPTSFTVPLPSDGPLAHDVFNAAVEISGGTTPVPAGCH